MAKVLQESSNAVETIISEGEVKIKSRILDNVSSKITKCRTTGCTIAQIHEAIILGGMEISLPTFKNYLARRKQIKNGHVLKHDQGSPVVREPIRTQQKDTYRDNSEKVLDRYPGLRKKR